MNKYTFPDQRPLSWSSISSFEYSREEWFNKYILGIAQAETAEMKFGKDFALSVEKKEPLAPVTIYSRTEYELNAKLGGIPLIGFMDTYEPKKAFVDHKTGTKEWTQKRADNHRQLDMYLFMLFLIHNVKPEYMKVAIEWVPTAQMSDFTIDFVRPIKVHRFPTMRTTKDILEFGSYIKKIYAEMRQFTKEHE